MTTLTEKAMITKVSIREWSARKLDRKATSQVIEANNATSEAGRFNKALVAKAALLEVGRAADAARGFHYANTMPWDDAGFRLLPSANFMHYQEHMRAHRAAYEAAVAAFCEGYPRFKEEARASLGDMFREADYPAIWDIREAFAFDIKHRPIADPSDFRVQLGNDEEQRIRAEIADANTALLDAAMRDVWGRVHETVGRMAERLRMYTVADGKTANPFRDSLVENVRDLAALLPRLNVTGDRDLDAIAARMAEGLCAHDPQELRESAALRNNVADEAAAILAAMSGYVGDVAPLAA